jgi:pyruvate formate lyase activating enzyme
MRTGLIFNVQKYSIHDGPGIRTTVFFKGCPLTCPWCHNPESRGRQPFIYHDQDRCLGCEACVRACPEAALSQTESGIRTDETRCTTRADCVEVCPSEARRLVGRRVTVAELLGEIEQDRAFYDVSGGGVTFSGGEPLLQWKFLVDVLEACGKRGMHRAVDTSGYCEPRVLRRVARETDLFLYDLKLMDPVLHEHLTGVPLEPILDNLSRLLEVGAEVRIRVPLIPGVTSDDSIRRTAALLTSLPEVDGVNLLPFHTSARDKHRKFGMPWLLAADDGIPRERIDAWAAHLAGRGLKVAVGG